MSRLFEAYSSLYNDWVKRRASKDPVWAAIEDRRHEGQVASVVFLSEEKGLGVAEWKLQLEIEDGKRQFPHPLWWLRFPYHIHWWLGSHGIKRQWWNLREYHQRGKKGYSIYDTFSLFNYLGKTIADSVDTLRQTTYGHPTELTEGEWSDILTKISTGFRAADKLDDLLYLRDHSDEETDLRAQLETGFDLLERWWFHLWN